MRNVSLILIALFATACSGPKESQRTAEESDSSEDLWRHEATFRPSEYDPNLETILKGAVAGEGMGDKPVSTPDIPRELELIPGFRVQLFSAQSIDEANEMKSEVEALFPDVQFYLVYDSPTYKIRGGNFLARFEADRFVKQLADRGYSDAWIVPEKVYKNPPPRPALKEDNPQQR